MLRELPASGRPLRKDSSSHILIHCFKISKSARQHGKIVLNKTWRCKKNIPRPLSSAPPFSQKQSNWSCSQSVTPPSCRPVARPGGNPPTLSGRAAPGTGSRGSPDSPSLRTPSTPSSCLEAGRCCGDRWRFLEGAGLGAGSRHRFCYRRIPIGLSVPGGCWYRGFAATHCFKRAQGQQKGHEVGFKWHQEVETD